MTIPPPLRPGDADAWSQLQELHAAGETFGSKRAVHEAVGGKWDKVTRLWDALQVYPGQADADPVDAAAEGARADVADPATALTRGDGESAESSAATPVETLRAEEVGSADPTADSAAGADPVGADPSANLVAQEVSTPFAADSGLTPEVSIPLAADPAESEGADPDLSGTAGADPSANPTLEPVSAAAGASPLGTAQFSANRSAHPVGVRNGKSHRGATSWSSPAPDTGEGTIVRETRRQGAEIAPFAPVDTPKGWPGAHVEGAGPSTGWLDSAGDAHAEEVSAAAAVTPAATARVSTSTASADLAAVSADPTPSADPVGTDPSADPTSGADPAADPVLTPEVSTPVSADPTERKSSPPARGADRVRPGVLTVVLWSVLAAVSAAVVVRAVQTPIGQRVWGWLAGAVGADAVTLGAAAGGAGLLAAVVGVAARVVARYRSARGQQERTPLAPRAYLVSALAFMGLSVDTTLRFFQDKLGITDWWELALIFGGMELGLLACGIAMREAVRNGNPVPASAQTVAWGLAGLAGLTGLLLGGWPGGIVRAAGPALAMVMMHLALGVELRHANGGGRVKLGAVARVAVELRERGLSRLGLSDEGRSAVSRSRQRHARRAARLAMQPGELDIKAELKRQKALQAALAKACVALDAEAAAVFLAEVEVLRAMNSTDELVAAVGKLSAPRT